MSSDPGAPEDRDAVYFQVGHRGVAPVVPHIIYSFFRWAPEKPVYGQKLHWNRGEIIPSFPIYKANL